MKITATDTGFSWLTASESIGRGAEADVYRVKSKDGEPAALKLFRADAAKQARACRARDEQHALLRRNQRPGIVSVGERVAAKGRPGYLLELALCDGRNVPDKLRVPMLLDVARTLRECHRDGVVHGDVSARNILMLVDRQEAHRYVLTDIRPSTHRPATVRQRLDDIAAFASMAVIARPARAA